jgi:hypothetical protein
MPEFERRHSEMEAAGMDATRATARLPGLDIEIVHRRAVEHDAEQIAIYLRAAPSFEAFGRALEAANPFGFWAQAAWQPWLAATTWAMALPVRLGMPQLSGENASRSTPECGSVSGGALHLAPP